MQINDWTGKHMFVHNENNSMLTVNEVYDILNIHPMMLRRWSNEGKIVTHVINSRGGRRYRKSDIDYFLSQFNPSALPDF